MALSRQMRARRFRDGALDLDTPELKFTIPPGASEPTAMHVYEPRATNAMIEEWMLLANMTVAGAIAEAFPASALLRRHPPPLDAAFANLQLLVAQYGFAIDISTPLALQKSIRACNVPEDPTFNSLVRILSTRLMQRAQYLSAGGAGERADLFHYGLAAPIYTHFTSPIRRYADQIVHRMLAASIGWEAEGAALRDGKRIKAIASVCNVRHFGAKDAQRASADLHTLLYFRNREVEEVAYVTQVSATGCQLLIPRLGVEGFIYASDRPPFDGAAEVLRATWDADAQTLLWHRPDDEPWELRTFSKLRVMVTVDPARMRPKLGFEILEVTGGVTPPEEGKDAEEVSDEDIKLLRSIR